MLLLQLTVEGGTAIAVFVRCFADTKGIEHELKRMNYDNFPRGLLAALSVMFSIFKYKTIAQGWRCILTNFFTHR